MTQRMATTRRSRGKDKLERTLGLGAGVAIIVGVMIGSGIFAFPAIVPEPPTLGLSIGAWGIAGILSLTGALSYAELGTAIPASGADQAYLRKATESIRFLEHLLEVYPLCFAGPTCS